MKKLVSAIAFSVILVFMCNAQGFYFDVGVGAGKAKTSIDNVDFKESVGSSVSTPV